jgi:hypothetical protein
MPAMWGIIGKIKMFNCLAKSVVRRWAGVAPLARRSGFYGYRHVRV